MATEPAKKESYAEYLKSLAELGIAVPEDNMFGTLGVSVCARIYTRACM